MHSIYIYIYIWGTLGINIEDNENEENIERISGNIERVRIRRNRKYISKKE